MKTEDTQPRSKGKPRGERLIWEGHRERLRQRMEREGWNALKPHEMVELVLFHAVPRQDLSDISRVLVDRFGSVGGVFAATREQLSEVPGMTATLTEWIALTGELMRAYLDLHGVSDIRLSCFQEVQAFLTSRLSQLKDEGMWALFADYNFNLITFSEIKESDTWWDSANVRRLLADAIGNGARYVYLVLWCEAVPTGMDGEGIARLESIATALRAAELDLVDCLLVGGDGIYSMNIQGKMKNIRAESGCMALHERYDKSDFSSDNPPSFRAQ